MSGIRAYSIVGNLGDKEISYSDYLAQTCSPAGWWSFISYLTVICGYSEDEAELIYDGEDLF